MYANFKSRTTSLLALKNKLSGELEYFNQIKAVIKTANSSNTLLSQLHELACHSHATGLESLHKFTLALFLPSFDTYLRPLNGWMTKGELNTPVYPEFFVATREIDGRPVFELVRDKGGVAAPRFMLGVVDRVIAGGKSMNFVKQSKPTPDIDEECFTAFFKGQASSKINPFEQSFENALESWIAKKYDIASNALRELIQNNGQLWDELDRIHGIYCMISHQAIGRFTAALFQRVSYTTKWPNLDGSMR